MARVPSTKCYQMQGYSAKVLRYRLKQYIELHSYLSLPQKQYQDKYLPLYQLTDTLSGVAFLPKMNPLFCLEGERSPIEQTDKDTDTCEGSMDSPTISIRYNIISSITLTESHTRSVFQEVGII